MSNVSGFMNEKSRAGGLLGTYVLKISKACQSFLYVMITSTANLEHDADAEIHEWFRKINNTLSSVIDRHAANGQVCFLRHRG